MENYSSGTERILFVDDEPDQIDLNRQLLEHLGYTVDCLDDSTRALARFEEKPDGYDVVITDMTCRR